MFVARRAATAGIEAGNMLDIHSTARYVVPNSVSGAHHRDPGRRNGESLGVIPATALCRQFAGSESGNGVGSPLPSRSRFCNAQEITVRRDRGPLRRHRSFARQRSVVVGLLDDRDYGTGRDTNGGAEVKWTSVDFVLSLGGELFFGDHFSVEATHGVKMNMTSVPQEVKDTVGAESFTSFSTFGENLTTIGFHFYF